MMLNLGVLTMVLLSPVDDVSVDDNVDGNVDDSMENDMTSSWMMMSMVIEADHD